MGDSGSNSERLKVKDFVDVIDKPPVDPPQTGDLHPRPLRDDDDQDDDDGFDHQQPFVGRVRSIDRYERKEKA